VTLDGYWVPVGAWVAGEVVPIAELRVARFVLQRGAWRIEDQQRQVVDRGEYRVDAGTDPKGLDIVAREGPNAGRTMLAIFELHGDLLTICYDLDGAERPQGTEPRDDQLLLMITYAREAARLSS
jgi:uncharacterized protein (TIGR03067 family)